jgi:hypothetical protein
VHGHARDRCIGYVPPLAELTADIAAKVPKLATLQIGSSSVPTER